MSFDLGERGPINVDVMGIGMCGRSGYFGVKSEDRGHEKAFCGGLLCGMGSNV